MGTGLKDKTAVGKNGGGGDPKDLPEIDARRLAWITEGADGRRDDKLVLYTEGKQVFLGEASAHADTAICRVRTKTRKSQRLETRVLDIPNEVDAVFLTDSAVEKFLFPYYESQRLFKPGEMEKLKREYYDEAKNYAGILHVQPSRPWLLLANGKIFRDFKVSTIVDDMPGQPQV